MKKKLLRFIKELFDKPIVKFFGYVAVIVFIFGFYGVFSDGSNSLSAIFRNIIDIVTSRETLSVFLAAAVSLCVARLLRACDRYLEESYKVNDDHHAIIRKYSGHKKEVAATDRNIADKAGQYMYITHLDHSRDGALRPGIRDRHAKAYKQMEQEIDTFKAGALFLPTLNVFTNVEGNTRMVFSDSREVFPMNAFVVSNAAALLSAHSSSATSNNSTVRLTDFHYDGEDGVLTLDTQRSTYYHMLMTNRCMDFEVYDGLSIRSVFEYGALISELADSQLSNQIGINGLLLTCDGYALIEKRDHRKTTWKNKFAQSISLALKTAELGIGSGVIPPTPEAAEAKLAAILYKTIRSNFGLTKAELVGFRMQDNLLGIARDLLEGGKPNLYFYMTADCTAEELCRRLEQNAARVGDGELQTGKLSSDYYLVPFDELRVGFGYTFRLDRRKCFWPRRHLRPRSGRLRSARSALRHKLLRRTQPVLTRECGEALLVTVSFLERCRARIDALNCPSGKED